MGLEETSTSKIINKSPEEVRPLLLKLKRLHQVSLMLSAEYDIQQLLTLILTSARELTNSDAGSIFIRYVDKKLKPNSTAKDPLYDVNTYLSLDVIQNESIDFPFQRAHIKIDSSTIAGFVAVNGILLNIKDAYNIPPDAPYKHSTAFDERTGYYTKSLLVVPMQNVDGEIIGILELINKRTGEKISDFKKDVIEFDELDEEIAMSLSSQAAICIEKTSLQTQIEDMFRGFVTSLCDVLETRNRATGGHCLRMAKYAVKLAEAINRQKEGPFKNIEFSREQIIELEYAGLLHDIGKISVPESILEKRTKLSIAQMKVIEYRFNTAKQILGEERIQRYWAAVKKLNIPDPEGKIDTSLLDEIKKTEFVDIDGQTKPLITEYEYVNLSVRRGNLTLDERKEIEKHAMGTWELLKGIPWPDHLENLPRIAAMHHERTDGSGYPWGFKSNDILLGGKMLALVDIFEALTAQDRSYKPALSIKDALRIIEEEVGKGKIDRDLFEIFKKEKLYALFASESGYVKFYQ